MDFNQTTMKEKAGRIFRCLAARWRPATLLALLVCCTTVTLLLNNAPGSKDYSPEYPDPSNECATLSNRTKTSVPDLNWTSCPSENELKAQKYFDHWDEKLAEELGGSAQSKLETKNESWYAVTVDMHIFSAFLVTTEYRAIHVISLVRDRMNVKGTFESYPPLVCLVRSSAGTREYAARIKLVWTWFNPPFKNAFIFCPPPVETIASGSNIEVAVTVRGADTSSLRWLPLHIPSDKADQKCCAVCVRPTFGSFISLWKVAEFIAHYRLVGARSFYFYDLEMAPDLKLLIGTLQAAGVDITLVSFKLLLDRADVHAEGQMPGLYDCIFRSMSKAEYFIHVDIDKFMFPLQNSSISAIVERVERKHGKDAVGSIVVKSRYYCTEYPIRSLCGSNKRVPLQTATFTYHCIDLQHGGFTKYIGRSKAICNAAVHTVVKHCGKARENRVQSSVAVINHYRRCCAFKKEDGADYLHIPFWNVSAVTLDEPFVEYLSDVENELAMRTMRRFLTKV